MDRAVDSDAESESGASLRPPHDFSSNHPGIPPTDCSDPVLHNARFLDGLSSAGRYAVLQSAQRHTYRRNSVVVEQGDSADRLFLLRKGYARHFFITPEGWDNLRDFMRTEGVSDDVLLSAGLVVKRESGTSEARENRLAVA